MKRFVLLAGLALAGCASTGPHEAALTGGEAAGYSRLVISRPGIMYAASSASVSVNGAQTCSLMPHGHCELNVPAGQVAVAVSVFGDFGTSTLVWQAQPGQTYNVQLQHKGLGYMMAGSLLGTLGGPLGAALAAGAGHALDNGNGGPLKIVLAQYEAGE